MSDKGVVVGIFRDLEIGHSFSYEKPWSPCWEWVPGISWRSRLNFCFCSGQRTGKQKGSWQGFILFRLWLVVPEVPDSAAQCQHPGTHQWKPTCHSDVSISASVRRTHRRCLLLYWQIGPMSALQSGSSWGLLAHLCPFWGVVKRDSVLFTFLGEALQDRQVLCPKSMYAYLSLVKA